MAAGGNGTSLELRPRSVVRAGRLGAKAQDLDIPRSVRATPLVSGVPRCGNGTDRDARQDAYASVDARLPVPSARL